MIPDAVDPAAPRRSRRRLVMGGSLSAAALVGLAGAPAEAAPAAWSLGGNKGVRPKGASFLGPRNPVPLVFKTTPGAGKSPAERLRVTPGGRVGIGTKTPTARLDVTATKGVTLHAGATGSTTTDAAVEGIATAGTGLRGTTNGTTDVAGVVGAAAASNAVGVKGTNTSGAAVLGETTAGGVGVFGKSSGYAVHGQSTGGIGVFGASNNGGVWGTGYVGVTGVAAGTTDSQGVRGENGGSSTAYAGVFVGKVLVTGTLSKSAGSFVIDHPLDPANKYLAHSFVESPDMKNLYDGVVALDDDGRATVVLPSYFEALNRDFRYQLTCLGGHAPVYVETEVAENAFTIAGGTPGLRVSWQVTGTRKDAYAEAHPIVVEQDKPEDDRGTYLFPDGAGTDRRPAGVLRSPEI